MSSERNRIKREILEVFEKKVKGQKPDLSKFNKAHDGAEGDWLTKRMGLTVNGKNEPDFKGFEMKKNSVKTTFGDWQPNYAIYMKETKNKEPEISRLEFLKTFGHPSKDTDGKKKGRYSWSGTVFPSVKGINDVGQVMSVDEFNNVKALYFFSKDKRNNKLHLIPQKFQLDELVIAQWNSESLKLRLERKFNNLGWFKCLTNEDGVYTEIQFGLPINFDIFIRLVRTGDVFCDCGMYSTNPRPYMQWRANKNIWDSLSEHPTDY